MVRLKIFMVIVGQDSKALFAIEAGLEQNHEIWAK